MSWEAIGAIAEVLGAMAVVGTLLFVAFEMRQNHRSQEEANRIARAAATDQIFEQFTGWRRLLASDPGIAKVWLEGRKDLRKLEAEDEVESQRFYALALDYIVVFSNWANRSIAVNDTESAERAVINMVLALQTHPGLRTFWDDTNDTSVSPEFARRVNAVLEHRGKGGGI